MEEFIKLTSIEDMAVGTMKVASAGGREYLVARTAEGVLVSQSRCPHLGAHLEEGGLEGTVITCPRHGSQFDLRDGRVVRWTDWQGATLAIAKSVKRPRPLKVYAVKIQGDDLLVGPEMKILEA